ncbi:hypothetical protein IEQ34_021619 [Dendrobium chrysotoxum]|uniref:Uncharacterized protein n=1 Tax=Dendrobium chrysotoxum TaxID=161865 RepID=A0AAV7G408_DENCH|nr:hypothetical protein IEQ34_021619 [Dendrobium chrysotoxum]
MNTSHASLAKPTTFFCNGCFPSRCSTFPTQFSRKPADKLMDYSVPFLKLPSWGSFAYRRRIKLQVYSQFRRPPRRRNSLREKLIPRQDQVLLFPEVSSTESKSEDLSVRDHVSDAGSLGIDFDIEKESGRAEDSKKFEFSGNSSLWDKLDNWVGRYKEDSEFWGIGAGPIFTIFQSCDGNVTHVSVNEDEILKRHRIRAWSLEENEESRELKDVNSKISIARLIAKEIEVGAYQMPRNSSIARFAVEGKKSSLVGLFHAFSSQRESLIRIFPRIGFMVLCCFCVLGAVRKLFVGYNDAELTREELEMLRRKKKSRMEREGLQRGSVQVLQNSDELPVISGTVPQLDRDELMKSIMQAKKSRDTLVLSNPSGFFTTEQHDFDKKVREIRDMVRQVREVEHKNQSSNNNTDEKDELSSIIFDNEIQTEGVENHAHHKAQSAKESVHRDDAAKTCSHSDQEDNTMICMDVKDMKTHSEEMAISMGEFSNGELLNNFGTCRNNNVVDTEGRETSSLKNSQGLPVGTHMSDPGAPDTATLSNKQEVDMNKVDNNSVRGEQTIKGSSVISTNKNGKAKIITSLKEAKEYLSSTCRIHKGSVQLEQPIHLKGTSEVFSNCADSSDGNLNRIRGTAKASGFAHEFSADKNAFSLPQRSLGNIVSDLKLYESYGEFNNSSSETEDIIKTNAGFQNGGSKGGTQEVLTVDGAVDLDDLQMGHNAGIINPSNDCVTSGGKNHNETTQHYQNQRYTDHTSQNKQAAKSKVILSDNSSLSDILDQVDRKMLKSLSHTQELNTFQGDQLDHVVVGRSENASTVCDAMTNEIKANEDWPTTTAKPELTPSAFSINLESSLEKDRDDDISHSYPDRTGVSGHFDPVADNVSFDASKAEDALNDLSSKASIPSNSGNSNCQDENLSKSSGKSWIEENFQQFDSVINEIGHGFKDNYMLAKVKAQENTFSSADISKLSMWGEDEELEWMKDENLREIVFQVRENELAGQDPFHLMDADDQKAFFQGLERKAEKANEKLAGVHEWIHSRIENLDYGADGISLDDPLDKIIPRWKGPPVDQDPEFLKKFTNMGILNDVLGDKPENLQKSQMLANSDGVSPDSPVNDRVILSQNGTSTAPKSLIECSDGSNRPGKKNLKEQWEHTKKWSQGFLEVYNSETDPEVKSILKDMGKDLDRWITEKEKKDVADLMTRIPKRKRRFIEKKVNKIKREVEKYGAQAVVSKYKEYAAEKEEDYLWWLDLQFVLCIELYSVEDDVPRVGFYSLEMAEDLELNPKQFHVIAFEDPGDSKNFCHIVQAQMDMLGSGKAFVVARPPKDAFREAKANGFSITVIRKGEVKLNVDQTLEEVEEDLKEVGSKIYHDKIMNERGVNIRSLMKGMALYPTIQKNKEVYFHFHITWKFMEPKQFSYGVARGQSSFMNELLPGRTDSRPIWPYPTAAR